MLAALEEKSMKIEAFVSDIELRFNSVEVSTVFYHTSFFSLYKITSKICLPCCAASLLPLKWAVSSVLKLTSLEVHWKVLTLEEEKDCFSAHYCKVEYVTVKH